MTTVSLDTGLLPASAVVPAACRFCGIEQREPLLERIERLVVVPSKGALVPGWVLVVPIDHVLTLAELPQPSRSPFAALVARVEARLLATVGPSVLFEHGPAAVGRSAGCGVDHAHLHVVPVPVDLRKAAVQAEVLDAALPWTPAAWPWEARTEPDKDYLFVRDADGAGWMAEATSLPSQAFRQTLCRHLRQEHWNWRDDRTTDDSDTTLILWTNAVAGRRGAVA